MVFERPLCVSLDGFTLHAATRAGGFDDAGREALPKYILRPAVAQERITLQPDGLVRIALKKAFSDGTVAIDLDPLSLLSRLAASVPAPRFHTVRYAGALGSASKLRARLVPKPVAAAAHEVASPLETPHEQTMPRRRPHRPWAELLMRTFRLDVLACPRCEGRMRLLALGCPRARRPEDPPIGKVGCSDGAPTTNTLPSSDCAPETTRESSVASCARIAPRNVQTPCTLHH